MPDPRVNFTWLLAALLLVSGAPAQVTVDYTDDAGVVYGGHVFVSTRIEGTCAEAGYAFLCDDASKLYGATEACDGLTPPE